MKISMLAIISGAVLVGILAITSSPSSEGEGQIFVTAGPSIIDPDDIPGTAPVSSHVMVLTGTVIDVALASLVIEDAGSPPVNIAVPGTAEIIRDGKHAELSELIPGDYARVDAVLDNSGKLTARAVTASKLR